MTSDHGGVIGLAGLTAIAVIALDQITKVLARNATSAGGVDVVGGWLRIVDVRNSGVAFGQLSGAGFLVALLVAIALGALGWYFLHHLGTPLIWVPTGLVFGGAVGNIVDRVRAGAVTDFIKLPHWPAFNLADAAITVGVVVLLILVELDARRQRKMEAGDAARDNS